MSVRATRSGSTSDERADWEYLEEVSTESIEQWWTTQELLELAWSKSYTEQECGARKLETWRGEGLLPKSQRKGQDGLRRYGCHRRARTHNC